MLTVHGLWTITAKDKSRFSFRNKINSQDLENNLKSSSKTTHGTKYFG
jgi:hypothetical protein